MKDDVSIHDSLKGINEHRPKNGGSVDPFAELGMGEELD